VGSNVGDSFHQSTRNRNVNFVIAITWLGWFATIVRSGVVCHNCLIINIFGVGASAQRFFISKVLYPTKNSIFN
jgi:hypothetical protein